MNSSIRGASDARGLAALSICESLALALAEEGILSKKDVCQAIEDLVAAHREAARTATHSILHQQAALIAEGVKESIAAAVTGKAKRRRNLTQRTKQS